MAAKKAKKTAKKTTAKKATKKSSKKPSVKVLKKSVKKVKKPKVVGPPPVLETFVKQDAVQPSVDSNGVVTMVPVKS